MNFSNQLKDFSDRISKIQNSIGTEEATKTSIVLPFFHLLGYDVFNPLEFVPEYTADAGTKKGEKVDYAIMKNNEPASISYSGISPLQRLGSAFSPMALNTGFSLI